MAEPRGSYIKERSTTGLDERISYEDPFDDERERKSRLTAVPPADPCVVSSRLAPSSTPSASSPIKARDAPSARSLFTIRNMVISGGGLFTFTATVATILGFVLDFQATLNQDISKDSGLAPEEIYATQRPSLTPPSLPSLRSSSTPTLPLFLINIGDTTNQTPLPTPPATGKIVNIIMESLGDDEFKESKTGDSVYSDTSQRPSLTPPSLPSLRSSSTPTPSSFLKNIGDTTNPKIVNSIMESLGDDEFKESKTGDSVYSDTSHTWTNYDWIELPDDIQNSLTSLGYDQFAWDNALPSEYEMLYWNDLSPEQQNAAMTLLQEDEASWNGWVYENDENGNNIYMNDWEDYGWSGLPQAIKDAMTILGWDESAWDNGDSIFTESMMWSELSSDQQNAAGLYGDDQQTWDAERTEEGQEEEEELTMADYDNMYWDELPQEIKDAMTVLGWGKSAWNLGESVSTDSMMWSELSSDQQDAAARIYGYDQQAWDAAVSIP